MTKRGGLYYLGGDLGSTHTRIALADETGQIVGFGESGSGNHEVVGFENVSHNVQVALDKAMGVAGINLEQIVEAGFGISGYDWDAEREAHLRALSALELTAPLEIVNDTILGLLVGSVSGWGIAVVSGTGCNCWGWNKTRTRIGQVAGGGWEMGEAGGSAELVMRAVQFVAHAWSLRGPATSLTDAFVKHVSAGSVDDLLEGLMDKRYRIDASAAPLVIRTAEMGDLVVNEVICWAGNELAELAKAVIRQLDFQMIEFELVLIGSLVQNNGQLREVFRKAVLDFAPQAKISHLNMPPVVGAVLLGMRQAGLEPGSEVKQTLAQSLARLKIG